MIGPRDGARVGRLAPRPALDRMSVADIPLVAENGVSACVGHYGAWYSSSTYSGQDCPGFNPIGSALNIP